MGLEEDLVCVAIRKDDLDGDVGVLKMRREYVQKLCIQAGLEKFFEDSLSFYTCVDGPVLVIWGTRAGRTKIVGLTLKVDELRPESAMRQAWEQHRSNKLCVADVHSSILKATNQVLN